MQSLIIRVKFVKFCLFANSLSPHIVGGSIVSGGVERVVASHLNSAVVK